MARRQRDKETLFEPHTAIREVQENHGRSERLFETVQRRFEAMMKEEEEEDEFDEEFY